MKKKFSDALHLKINLTKKVKLIYEIVLHPDYYIYTLDTIYLFYLIFSLKMGRSKPTRKPFFSPNTTKSNNSTREESPAINVVIEDKSSSKNLFYQ